MKANTFTPTKTVFPIVLAVLVAALACGRTDPAASLASPTPVAAPTAVSAQAEPEAPVSDDGAAQPAAQAEPETPQFEATLARDDLAKFRVLPAEFQDALRQAYDAEGADAAVQYLRGLPDDTLPVADVLEPHALGWFGVLQPQDQRYMLLEAYPAAYDRFAGPEWTDGSFAFAFQQMVGVAFDNRGVRLPPVEEALSAEALAKLDSVDPLFSRVFRLVWNESKPLPIDVDDTIARLQSNLLAAPVDLPSLEEIGLSAEASRQFSELPTDIQDWLWKTVANSILSSGLPYRPLWPVEDEYISTLSTPAAKEMFDRGIEPRSIYVHGPSTFACLDSPSHWPDAVAARMPQGIDDLPVVVLPPYQDVLSPDVLARLNTLDANLKAAFENMWRYSQPVTPAYVLCDITKFERGLMDIPVTSAPAAEDLLSDEGLALYHRLADDGREWIDEGIAQAILSGLVVIFGEPGSQPEHVWSFDTPPEAYIDAVAAHVEERLEIMFAADSKPAGRAADDPAQQQGTDDLPPAIQILSPAYQEAYRLLPDGELAQRYFATRFEGFDYQEWLAMGEAPPEVWDAPREFDPGTEWKLTRILRDHEEQEWFVRRIRELDADAARSFEATQAEEDRIEILGALFEEGRKDQEILEIIVEWEMRNEGLQGEELARQLESYRDMVRHMEELSSLPPKEGTVRLHELSVCDLVSHFVIDGRPSDAASWRAGCDIDASVSAARQALESRGGQPLVDEEEFREMLESLEQLRNPPPEPTPSIDS